MKFPKVAFSLSKDTTKSIANLIDALEKAIVKIEGSDDFKLYKKILQYMALLNKKIVGLKSKRDDDKNDLVKRKDTLTDFEKKILTETVQSCEERILQAKKDIRRANQEMLRFIELRNTVKTLEGKLDIAKDELDTYKKGKAVIVKKKEADDNYTDYEKDKQKLKDKVTCLKKGFLSE